jgi:hypothetical protein
MVEVLNLLEKNVVVQQRRPRVPALREFSSSLILAPVCVVIGGWLAPPTW